MRIRGLQEEDFVNYKLASMYIALGTCNWKCCIEGGFDKAICQNSPLAHAEEMNVTNENLYTRYINNPITSAIVIGGLEPFTRFDDILSLIKYFRSSGCYDEFVIYTGYCPNEILDKLEILKQYGNIIMKYGRFRPDNEPHIDKVLGVELASDNQWGERLC